ncbi:protein of unknown function [Paraburkholderia dioscoreae]|uniref:Uncharacterized protein n=1 Tax=Paraburkholderia dioscoreae TaxID=2604047 RepID=A0A5Q4ZIW8_9BURK|nr:protein of unknown function [Paraburkholderia dioscoreae]
MARTTARLTTKSGKYDVALKPILPCRYCNKKTLRVPTYFNGTSVAQRALNHRPRSRKGGIHITLVRGRVNERGCDESVSGGLDNDIKSESLIRRTNMNPCTNFGLGRVTRPVSNDRRGEARRTIEKLVTPNLGDGAFEHPYSQFWIVSGRQRRG